MEVFYNVSLCGKFLFRTDVFLNPSQGELVRVEASLQILTQSDVNYEITRSERPAIWKSKKI